MKTRWIQQACDLLRSLVVLLLWFLLSSYALGGEKNVPETRFTQLLVPVPLDVQTRGMRAGRRRGDGTFDGTSYRNPNTELACPGQLTLLCMFVPVCVKTGTSPVWGVIKDHYSSSPLLHGSMIGHISVWVAALSVSHRLVQEARGLNGLSISCQRSGDKTNRNHSLHLSVV